MKFKKYKLIPINKKINHDVENYNVDYHKTIEIRNKRIHIVFKVIYVFAIFFASILFDLVKQFKNGLNEIYIVEDCIVSFLLIVIFHMIDYIFNEMKCLKINSFTVKTKSFSTEENYTEESYNDIFYSFKCSVILTFVLMFIVILLQKYFTLNIVIWTFAITMVLMLISYKYKNITFFKFLYEVTGILCFFSFFLIAALNDNDKKDAVLTLLLFKSII